MPNQEPELNTELKAFVSPATGEQEILRIQTFKERAREFFAVFANNLPIRITLFICGILVPFMSFYMGGIGAHWGGEPWQSGNLGTYAGLLLTWPVAAAFYPLLLYSMACLGTWIFNPARFTKKYWIRLGVYLGVVWSIVFSWIAYIDSSSLIWGTMLICGIMYFVASIGFAIIWGIAWFVVKAQQTHWWLFFACSIVGLFILLSGSLVLGIFGPPLTLISFAIAAVSIWTTKERSFQFSIAKLLGTTTYLAAAFASWRLAIDLMLIEYNKLPTQDPNCFVSAAAAKGHPTWVGSEQMNVHGNKIFVNQQMRVFKAGEFALAAVCPRMHRVIRRIYNGVGPRLASGLGQYKLAADTAFVALVPIQAVFSLLLALLGIDRQKIRNLYRF